MALSNNLAVYIHWPYCKSKCPYCDFYKELSGKEDQNQIIDSYIESLDRYWKMMPNRCVQSVFFGGGTPSLIHANNIERVIDFIYKKWKVAENIEISLEANPNTHSEVLFSDLKGAGINRLSLGIQALNDNDLKFLGRTHSVAMARQCLEEAVKIFDNHSADLIYARPNQSLTDWQVELNEIASYGLKHLSLYQLTIEEGTAFSRKNIQPLDEEKAVHLYNYTRDFLRHKGYKHYEISNFAKDGYQSRHNLTYWQGGDYIGIGKSAHGRFCINGDYIAAVFPFQHEKLSPKERAEELIIMGLRLKEGIHKEHFSQLCGLNFDDVIRPEKLAHFKNQKLLVEEDQTVRLSYKGFLFCDYIATQLCC